jgi:hypothetical protein
MMRTSLYLPPALHERLRIAGRQEKQAVSTLIRDLLDTALAAQENVRLDRMYKELSELSGAGEAGVRDTSTTLDETLYGENGAWRGDVEM